MRQLLHGKRFGHDAFEAVRCALGHHRVIFSKTSSPCIPLFLNHQDLGRRPGQKKPRRFHKRTGYYEIGFKGSSLTIER